MQLPYNQVENKMQAAKEEKIVFLQILRSPALMEHLRPCSVVFLQQHKLFRSASKKDFAGFYCFGRQVFKRGSCGNNFHPVFAR